MTQPPTTDAAASDIATVTQASDQMIDPPRTGEPRRPWSAWAAALLLYLGVAVITAGLLWTWWLSVAEWPVAAPTHTPASDLVGEQERSTIALLRAGIAIGEFAVTVLIGSAALIAGYYGWRGYRWTRWAGVIAAVLAFGALVLNAVAWAGIGLLVLGAIALWLPPTRDFFARWHAVRHPEPHYPDIVDAVAYGPLPRYRSNP